MRLVFAFVGSAASFVAGSGVRSRVAILSKFFIGNNLLLTLLRSLFLALKLNNNPKLFKKDFFSNVFVPVSKFFNLIAKLFCLWSIFCNDKYPSCISLKKQYVMNIYQNYKFIGALIYNLDHLF